MKLASTYAAATGLKIGRPLIQEQFFPLGFEKYITVQTGSGQHLKNYDYWNDVMRLLAPFLAKSNIHVIHLGAKGDSPLPGTENLCGVTNLRQSIYILRRSLLHLGNDSWQAHMAAEAGVPLVALYGTTSAEVHGPYWKNEEKTILLESHRCSNKPSFGSPEPQKTINFIPPEDVANSALKLLGISEKVDIQKSYYIGPYYGHNMFEIVPNMILAGNLYPDVQASVKMDYFFNEDNLFKQSQVRKIHIFTDKPIKLELVKAIMPNMLGFNYEVNIDTDFNYLKALKNLGGKQIYFSKETNQSILDDIRFKFFDIAPIEFVETKTKEKFLEDSSVYLNNKLTELPKNLKYSSNKLLFSNDKMYLCKADWLADKPISSAENPISTLIDSPDFWMDYPHYHVYA